MTELTDKMCGACADAEDSFDANEIAEYTPEIDEDWQVIDNHHLERKFDFDDFQQALDFINDVGELAENENHHPDLYLTWGEAKVTIWTHSVDGLTEADFIFAAKTDEIRS
jgi:4a-hydroxytetrahydrobiopterin dehydratase